MVSINIKINFLILKIQSQEATVEDKETPSKKINTVTIKEIMIQGLQAFKETVMISSFSESVVQVEATNHASNAMKKVILQKIVLTLDQEWEEEQVEKAVITVVNQVIL